MTSHPLVQVDSISKRFSGRSEPVLDGLSLELYSGESTLIMGRSGSGKSTLLNCIAGLESVDHGTITLADTRVDLGSVEELASLRLHHIGIVFQFFNLIPSLSLKENILLPGTIAGSRSVSLENRADELMEFVGISHVAHQLPESVSGGEAQRAAIARALLLEPDIILADEPTGNLDEENAEQIIDLFRSLTRDQKVAVCLVSHNPEYRQMCDRIYSFQRGSLVKES